MVLNWEVRLFRFLNRFLFLNRNHVCYWCPLSGHGLFICIVYIKPSINVSTESKHTVEPLLSGHPRGIGNWPFNRGWPLNKGSSGIKFWLRENVNLFKYKHALSFLTIVTCNTASHAVL